jgi:hypothetical protein
MLYAERKRLREIAEREGAGEDLWTHTLDEAARVKLVNFWEFVREQEFTSSYSLNRFEGDIRHWIESGLGIRTPSVSPGVLLTIADNDVLLSYIEVLHKVFSDHAPNFPNRWEVLVNRTFNEHRFKFRLVGGEVVPFENDALHVEVVEPALRLLIKDAQYGKAADAYLAALKEITNNDPADAITDAGTALQEMLQGLGCDGHSLGPLIKDAKKKGLLGSHDSTLTDGIEKFMHWASADRSEMGDAHKSSDATLDDAWLMVHIVGSLIVRLAGSPRG